MTARSQTREPASGRKATQAKAAAVSNSHGVGLGSDRVDEGFFICSQIQVLFPSLNPRFAYFWRAGNPLGTFATEPFQEPLSRNTKTWFGDLHQRNLTTMVIWSHFRPDPYCSVEFHCTMTQSELNPRFTLVRLKAKLYARTGLKRWYKDYRETILPQAVQWSFDSTRLSAKYGWRVDERIVEFPWLLSRLSAGNGKLLDAGSALNHDFLVHHPVLRQKEVTIMTLAPEEICFWRDGISYIYGDLRRTCLRDNYFDYVASISTIEHIGMNNTLFYTEDTGRNENDPTAYLSAVHELRRILKPGGISLITVPYGERSIREWIQIFDGEMVESVVNAFQPTSHAITYFRYGATDGWQLSSREAAQDAKYFDPTRDTPWPGCPLAAEAVAH
jgi:hypothetical protein